MDRFVRSPRGGLSYVAPTLLAMMLASTVGCEDEVGADKEDLTALEEQVTTIEGEQADLASQLEGVPSDDDLAALSARIDSLEDDLVNAETLIATLESDLAAVVAAQPTRIEGAVTVSVPGDYANINAALASLNGSVIPAGSSVTIAMADGTYTHTEPIRVTRGDAGRIFITGNTDNPESVVLEFTGSPQGITGRGPLAMLGWVDGVTIRGDGTDGSSGVLATDGALLQLGQNVIVEGWGYAGVVASRNGIVKADGVLSQNNGGPGFLAQNGGILDAYGAESRDNGGHGFSALWGGVIQAGDSLSDGNDGDGYNAEAGSAIAAWSSEAMNNGQGGYGAYFTSHLAAGDSTASLNQWDGFTASGASSLDVPNAISDENSGSGFSANGSSAINAGGEAVASDNGGSGINVGGASFGWAQGIESSGNGFVGASAGATSTLEFGGDALITGNTQDGVHANGYSYVEASGIEVTDNGFFGLNVFWGAWIMANDVTVSGHDIDFNLGPHTDVQDEDWGVIYQD